MDSNPSPRLPSLTSLPLTIVKLDHITPDLMDGARSGPRAASGSSFQTTANSPMSVNADDVPALSIRLASRRTVHQWQDSACRQPDREMHAASIGS